MNIDHIKKLRDKLLSIKDEQFDQRVGFEVRDGHNVGSLAGWAARLKNDGVYGPFTRRRKEASIEGRAWLGINEPEWTELFGYRNNDDHEKVNVAEAVRALDRLVARARSGCSDTPLWDREYRPQYKGREDKRPQADDDLTEVIDNLLSIVEDLRSSEISYEDCYRMRDDLRSLGDDMDSLGIIREPEEPEKPYDPEKSPLLAYIRKTGDKLTALGEAINEKIRDREDYAEILSKLRECVREVNAMRECAMEKAELDEMFDDFPRTKLPAPPEPPKRSGYAHHEGETKPVEEKGMFRHIAEAEKDPEYALFLRDLGALRMEHLNERLTLILRKIDALAEKQDNKNDAACTMVKEASLTRVRVDSLHEKQDRIFHRLGDIHGAIQRISRRLDSDD